LVAIKDKGQSRIASQGLSLLAAAPACSPDLAEQAHIANGYALWDLDQYAAMDVELEGMTTRGPRQLLRAMIATARGEFALAKSLYDELAADHELDADLATKIPMRSAPALIGLGEGEQAERQLLASLSQISRDDLRARAEILGHIGEALTEQGRFSEAEQRYQESMALNRQLGCLIGQGVCHATLGDLFCRLQRFDEARAALDLALDVARRVDNPWREAWTLLRLARVAEGTGDARAAATLSQDGHAIFARLGCHPQ
jgi:tetratricopeptide (TPR) repeat protein